MISIMCIFIVLMAIAAALIASSAPKRRQCTYCSAFTHEVAQCIQGNAWERLTKGQWK